MLVKLDEGAHIFYRKSAVTEQVLEDSWAAYRATTSAPADWATRGDHGGVGGVGLEPWRLDPLRGLVDRARPEGQRGGVGGHHLRVREQVAIGVDGGLDRLMP